MSSVMFIAGDPSGDIHAAPIVSRLKQTRGSIDIWGIGGPCMEREGLRQSMPFAPFNRMGFIEVVVHIGFFLKAKKRLIGEMEARRPDVVVCVDYSGFNIPMMKAADRMGIPVVWYIAPMVWAWKPKRAAVLGDHARHIAVIFPFEIGYFTGRKAAVSYVGNPLMESMRAEGRLTSDFKRTGTITSVALVPGSREQEVRRILPAMAGCFHLLREKFGPLNATVSCCPSVDTGTYDGALAGSGSIVRSREPLRDILARADFALVTSGTATLETALMGVPLVIAYKTSPITYTIFKRLVTIGHIGLPNILAGRGIVPECIQSEVSEQGLYEKAAPYFQSTELYRQTCGSFIELRSLLGTRNPSEQVAGMVLNCIGKSGTQV